MSALPLDAPGHGRALIIRNLVKEYRAGQPVLRDISLRVDEPGIVAIIGPSGTGKSTLIRCINRLVDPTSGSILLGGVDLATLQGDALRQARRRLGMVFQEYNLVERLTVIENVLCGRLGYVPVWRAWTRRFPEVELRGFVGTTLRDAFDEAHAISKATKAKQFLFSLSLNPPRDADVDIDALTAAADRAETQLGLSGQPRAIVVHEKEGRRHAHVVWSRIDAKAMKAINHPFFKTRLAELSRELFLDHGWELPEGHRTNGWTNPLNFTLDQWQQARRLGLDPREIKQVFQDAWKRSDNLASFRHALEEHGYFLARGDRRGFVALDIHGEPFAVPRWLGLKTKEVETRLGDPSLLPGVEDVRQSLKTRLSERIRALARDHRQAQADQRAPLLSERNRMVASHRAERETLREGQDTRWKAEARARADRIRTGLRGVLDLLTGRTRSVRAENERDALASHRRDKAQAEALYQAQARERRVLQDRLDDLTRRQRHDRRLNARRIAVLLRQGDPPTPPSQNQNRTFRRGRAGGRGPSLTR